MNASNKKCRCGSGKKSKNCCANKKVRSHVVTIKPGALVDQLAINSLTGEIRLFYKGVAVTPECATSAITYPREKSPKIISKTDASLTNIRPIPDAILSNYDRIFAIDTNRKYIPDVEMYLSVTGIVAGKSHQSYFRNEASISYGVIHAIEFWDKNETLKFERIGWYETIKRIQKAKEITEAHKIGIIVDSYLDDLPNINNRTQPIINDFYLPHNFHLMYANSDKKNSSIMNKMIAASDKHATEIMNNIIQKWPIGNMIEPSGEPYKYIRHWKNN